MFVQEWGTPFQGVRRVNLSVFAVARCSIPCVQKNPDEKMHVGCYLAISTKNIFIVFQGTSVGRPPNPILQAKLSSCVFCPKCSRYSATMSGPKCDGLIVDISHNPETRSTGGLVQCGEPNKPQPYSHEIRGQGEPEEPPVPSEPVEVGCFGVKKWALGMGGYAIEHGQFIHFFKW